MKNEAIGNYPQEVELPLIPPGEEGRRWSGGEEMVRGVAMTAKPRANGADARSKEAHPCPTKGD